MNADTGAEIWQSTYTTDYVDMYGYGNGPRVAPLIDGDHVYTFGVEGRLRCLKVAGGAPAASSPAGGGRPLLAYPSWSPPVLAHGLLRPDHSLIRTPSQR